MYNLEPNVIRKLAEEQGLFFLGAGYAAAYGQTTTGAICERIREAVMEESGRHSDEKTEYAKEKIATLAPKDLAGLSELYDYYLGTDAAKKFVAARLLSRAGEGSKTTINSWSAVRCSAKGLCYN